MLLKLRTLRRRNKPELSARGKEPVASGPTVSRPRNATWAGIVDAADKAVFTWKVRKGLYKHLASQIANGVATEIALDKHAAALERRKKGSCARIVRDAGRLMRDGKTLSEALAKWMPADEMSVIAAGDVAGVLPESMKELVATKRRVRKVSIAYRNAFVRPAIYSLTMYGVVWAIGKYAVPQMALFLPPNKTTGVVGGLIAAGGFAMSWQATLPPLFLLLLAFAIRYSLSRWTGRWRVHAERRFPYSYYRDSEGFLWLSSFVALLTAGEPDVDILRRQTKYASPWLKERLLHFRRAMTDGDTLPTALIKPVNRRFPAFDFPSPEIVGDIESLHGFRDFKEKMRNVLQEWAEDLEETTLEKAAVFGFSFEIFMYAVMGVLMYAINEITMRAAG